MAHLLRAAFVRHNLFLSFVHSSVWNSMVCNFYRQVTLVMTTTSDTSWIFTDKSRIFTDKSSFFTDKSFSYRHNFIFLPSRLHFFTVTTSVFYRHSVTSVYIFSRHHVKHSKEKSSKKSQYKQEWLKKRNLRPIGRNSRNEAYLQKFDTLWREIVLIFFYNIKEGSKDKKTQAYCKRNKNMNLTFGLMEILKAYEILMKAI